MALYILTSYIRPLMYLARRMKLHSLDLQAEVHYPDQVVQSLVKRVTELEGHVSTLTGHLNAERDESDRRINQALAVQVEPHLRGLNHDMKKSAKLDKRYMQQQDERFAQLEQMIQQQRTDSDINQRQRQRPILSTLYWLLDSVPNFTSFVTLPLHLMLTLSTWWIPNVVRKRLPFHGGLQQVVDDRRLLRGSVSPE